MNRAEFMEMRANCVTAMQAYFVQVEKTSTMLAESTAEPLTFRERFRVLSQGIVENDARLAYLGARTLLLSRLRSLLLALSKIDLRRPLGA